jgi:hypothetical protein
VVVSYFMAQNISCFLRSADAEKIIRCSAPAWFACSVPLTLAQDPSSYNLGTTVWDASIVLAKWLEKVIIHQFPQ